MHPPLSPLPALRRPGPPGRPGLPSERGSAGESALTTPGVQQHPAAKHGHEAPQGLEAPVSATRRAGPRQVSLGRGRSHPTKPGPGFYLEPTSRGKANRRARSSLCAPSARNRDGAGLLYPVPRPSRGFQPSRKPCLLRRGLLPPLPSEFQGPARESEHLPCDMAPLRKRQGCAVQNPGGACWKPPGSPQTGRAGGGMWQRKCEAIPGVWDFL